MQLHRSPRHAETRDLFARALQRIRWLLLVLLAPPVSLAAVHHRVSFADSAGVCSVLAYGAICDNRTDDAPAIQRALDDVDRCASVVVPSGRTCVSRALNISSMSSRTLDVQVCCCAVDLYRPRAPALFGLLQPSCVFVNLHSRFSLPWIELKSPAGHVLATH
jgi:hypothetical protein